MDSIQAINTVSVVRERKASKRRCRATLVLLSVWLLGVPPASGQETIEVGETGFEVKRPVLASACPNGCPWGELGDFVKEAMEPLDYEVILCRNCNRDRGPRVVANASYPPELDAIDAATGTTSRVNAPVDFGVTESSFLASAHGGFGRYATEGPYDNLRLIAKIEDPYLLLAAVKAESGITDLAQIADERMPVRILGGGASERVLDYYGITREAVASWGGSIDSAMVVGMLEGADADFDVIISELATPANNPESAYWTAFSQRHDLHFLELPEELLDEMVEEELGMERVVARWGFLRGVDRPIPTVGRSGEAVFARDDTPEEAAYDVAKAIDEHRGALKWFIRPYSYDSRSVWKNYDVPLHPGAERYYREMGYMTDPDDDADEDVMTAATDCSAVESDSCPSADELCEGASQEQGDGGGCRVAEGERSGRGPGLLAAMLVLLLACRRRRRTQHTAGAGCLKSDRH